MKTLQYESSIKQYLIPTLKNMCCDPGGIWNRDGNRFHTGSSGIKGFPNHVYGIWIDKKGKLFIESVDELFSYESADFSTDIQEMYNHLDNSL